MKIVFCSSEAVPFAKTGGLADVVGALPSALKKLKVDVSVFLPYYRCVKQAKIKTERISSSILRAGVDGNISIYFVKNDKFFDKDGLYGNSKGDYRNNLDRFQFFCVEILNYLKKSGDKPDIIHCHDWHTALIPVYLKEHFSRDAFYQGIKTVLTIHNLAYQGIFGHEEYKKLHFEKDLFHMNAFEFYGKVNLLKAGIIYADELTTVSPQYAKEVCTKEFGCGLEGVIKHRQKKIIGILNGLDYDLWNPKTDKLICTPYSSVSGRTGKDRNKTFLQLQAGLRENSSVPLIGFVGRLSHQKGIDLILESMDDLMKLNLQIVMQGVGDSRYVNKLKKLSKKYAGQFCFSGSFDERMAHQIYAGSDFYLMPSEFEPCGLGQMIALSYASIPIVSKVGGLADTITSAPLDKSNGIFMLKNNPAGLLKAVKEAVQVYGSKKQLASFIDNAFKTSFTWEDSALQYRKIYQCLLSD